VTQPPDQPFGEESLLRALRSPGSADELGEEERYVAMFREARASGDAAPAALPARTRRTARRMGASSALVVALAVGGGGVAAAYTGNLPEPIQEFAHRALGPVAPPAPDEQRPHRAEDHATADASSSSTPTATSSPSATPTPTATPTHPASAKPSHSQKPTPSATPTPTPSSAPSSTPTTAPSATPTPTTTPTPTATPTPTSSPTVSPPAVAAVSISGSTHKVEPGQSVAFAGVVTSDSGLPMRKKVVILQVRTGDRWVAVTSGRTDATGQVTLVLPPIERTTGVRLRSHGVHSARWRVTLHPQVSLTSSPGDQAGTAVITATVVGGQSGDQVVLATTSGQVATRTLSGGTVSFAVTPEAKKTRYLVLLPATSEHGPDKAWITVIVKKPARVTSDAQHVQG
jgi:hypothetical protein